jgi:hypothetical protein
VAKEATIFRGVPIRKWCLFILFMAVKTKFFSLFFTFNGMERIMDIIVGQRRGRFFRSVEEEHQDTRTEEDK